MKVHRKRDSKLFLIITFIKTRLYLFLKTKRVQFFLRGKLRAGDFARCASYFEEHLVMRKRFRYKFTIKCVIYSTVDSLKCWSISQKVRSSKNLWRWKVVVRLDRCFLRSKFHSLTCRVFLRASSFDCLSFRCPC